MVSSRSIDVVGIHTAGETCDVVVGGVLDVPGKTMYDKMMHMWTKNDSLRQLLLQQPRGSSAMCRKVNLPSCNPDAHAGLLTMEHEECPSTSGANVIAVASVLLELGMVPMQSPVTQLSIDAAAGLIQITAECDAGKCKARLLRERPVLRLRARSPRHNIRSRHRHRRRRMEQHDLRARRRRLRRPEHRKRPAKTTGRPRQNASRRPYNNRRMSRTRRTLPSAASVSSSSQSLHSPSLAPPIEHKSTIFSSPPTP